MVIGRITQQECNSFANVETPQRCHLSHGNGRIYRAAHHLAAGFNAFNILLGHYVQVNLGDLLLNSVICMAVWLARGNLAKVVITE